MAVDSHITCPHCSEPCSLCTQQVQPTQGQAITCPRCHQTFAVNESQAPAAPRPAAFPAGMQPLSYATPVAALQTNRLAVLSLVFGSLALAAITVSSRLYDLSSRDPYLPDMPAALCGIAAVTCGLLGWRKTRNPQVGGRRVAGIGLLMGTVTVLLVAHLTFIYHNGNRDQESNNRHYCASNLRQIAQAILLYANANNGQYPPRLEELLLTQQIGPDVFICDSTQDTPAPGSTPQAQAASLSAGGHCSYIYVAKGLTTSAPPNTVVLYEPLTNHGNEGMNVLFADGDIEFFDAKTSQAMLSDLAAGHNPPRLPSNR